MAILRKITVTKQINPSIDSVEKWAILEAIIHLKLAHPRDSLPVDFEYLSDVVKIVKRDLAPNYKFAEVCAYTGDLLFEHRLTLEELRIEVPAMLVLVK